MSNLLVIVAVVVQVVVVVPAVVSRITSTDSRLAGNHIRPFRNLKYFYTRKLIIYIFNKINSLTIIPKEN